MQTYEVRDHKGQTMRDQFSVVIMCLACLFLGATLTVLEQRYFLKPTAQIQVTPDGPAQPGEVIDDDCKLVIGGGKVFVLADRAKWQKMLDELHKQQAKDEKGKAQPAPMQPQGPEAPAK